MSVCVTIRTRNRPAPEDVFKALADTGEQLVVTSSEYPCARAGNSGTALRGIELNEDENGVEVRVCFGGSPDDYRLFGKAVQTVMDISGGKAYRDDEEEEEITDPLSEFDEKWVQDQVESNFGMLKTFACKYGQEMVLYGLFADICIGPRLFDGFDIDVETASFSEEMERLQNYLVNLQWYLSDKRDTGSRLLMTDPDDPDARKKTISLICISEGKVNEFDYISNADILAFMDLDNEENQPVMVPFKKINKILPCKGFRILDEHQYELTEPLAPEWFHEIMDYARIFMPDDLMKKPLRPGEGFDEEQNTVILMWNPAVSSVKMEDHNAGIPDLFTEEFNWSVREHDKAKCGDRFFLVRCGDGRTGIVMSGVFDSQAYQPRDRSGKNRQTYYMEMAPNVVLNPEVAPMVTTAELEQAMPDFQWSGGHSGRILPQEYAKKLEGMWEEFLTAHHEEIDGETLNAFGQFGK